MKIRHNGKNLRIKDCRGIKSIRGLMFDDMKKIDGALISGNSIWMPFVRYPLALFFLDGNFSVIEKHYAVPMTLNPKTWRIYSCKKAKYCLEVKENINIKKGVKII